MRLSSSCSGRSPCRRLAMWLRLTLPARSYHPVSSTNQMVLRVVMALSMPPLVPTPEPRRTAGERGKNTLRRRTHIEGPRSYPSDPHTASTSPCWVPQRRKNTSRQVARSAQQLWLQSPPRPLRLPKRGDETVDNTSALAVLRPQTTAWKGPRACHRTGSLLA